MLADFIDKICGVATQAAEPQGQEFLSDRRTFRYAVMGKVHEIDRLPPIPRYEVETVESFGQFAAEGCGDVFYNHEAVVWRAVDLEAPRVVMPLFFSDEFEQLRELFGRDGACRRTISQGDLLQVCNTVWRDGVSRQFVGCIEDLDWEHFRQSTLSRSEESLSAGARVRTELPAMFEVCLSVNVYPLLPQKVIVRMQAKPREQLFELSLQANTFYQLCREQMAETGRILREKIEGPPLICGKIMEDE